MVERRNREGRRKFYLRDRIVSRKVSCQEMEVDKTNDDGIKLIGTKKLLKPLSRCISTLGYLLVEFDSDYADIHSSRYLSEHFK